MNVDEIEARLKGASPVGPSPALGQRIAAIPGSRRAGRFGFVIVALAAIVVAGELDERHVVARLRQSPVVNPASVSQR